MSTPLERHLLPFLVCQGAFSTLIGFAGVLVFAQRGWTSAVVSELVLGGIILISLGVIAEYVGLAATMSMGKPGYVILDDPERRFREEPDSL